MKRVMEKIPPSPPLLKRGKGDYWINKKGITLIELIVVIAIIGILSVALGFEFVGWMARYRVESQIKEMQADLMSARVRAMQRNRLHIADFPSATATSTQYRIREDTDENNDSSAAGVVGDTILPTFPKTVTYAMTRAGGAITTEIIAFDARGTIQPTPALGTTLCLSTTVNPDYDCIVIAQTRINMGKLTISIPDGGGCGGDPNNCVAR